MGREEKNKEGKTDLILLILVLLLVATGMVMLFFTSEYNGRVRFGDSAYYFKKQLFATSLGLLVMYSVARTDYHFFIRLAPFSYLLAMGLSTAVLPDTEQKHRNLVYVQDYAHSASHCGTGGLK